MPQISRFYGIIILMNYKDHLPPHFHAIYNEYEIIVNIQDGETKGRQNVSLPGVKRHLETMTSHEYLKNYKSCVS